MSNLQINKIELSSEETEVLASVTLIQERRELINAKFNQFFAQEAESLAQAGGRVNLIGEHVDYPDLQFNYENPSHLYSMGGAVQNNFLVALSLRDDSILSVIHLNAEEQCELDLSLINHFEAQAIKEREEQVNSHDRELPGWINHTLGAIKQIELEGHKIPGMNLILTSNVPHGAGMSNSAANCVALALAFNQLIPSLELSEKIDIVTFARNSENSKFVGGQCGWLDQLLIVNSAQNKLTKIDYADNSIDHFDSHLPEQMQFLAINTNVPHVLAESDYGHRVQELTYGLTLLSKCLNREIGSPSLSLNCLNELILNLDSNANSVSFSVDIKLEPQDVGLSLTKDEVSKLIDLIENKYEIPDLPEHKGLSPKLSYALLLKRIRHQKMSSMIVPLAGQAALKGDVKLFGELLSLEGESLRMSGDFQITGDNGAQDALLDICFDQAKSLDLEVYGRMLGGGGGGNVLIYADRSHSKYNIWKEAVVCSYASWAEAIFPNKGIEASIIEPVMSEGAFVIY